MHSASWLMVDDVTGALHSLAPEGVRSESTNPLRIAYDDWKRRIMDSGFINAEWVCSIHENAPSAMAYVQSRVPGHVIYCMRFEVFDLPPELGARNVGANFLWPISFAAVSQLWENGMGVETDATPRPLLPSCEPASSRAMAVLLNEPARPASPVRSRPGPRDAAVAAKIEDSAALSKADRFFWLACPTSTFVYFREESETFARLWKTSAAAS